MDSCKESKIMLHIRLSSSSCIPLNQLSGRASLSFLVRSSSSSSMTSLYPINTSVLIHNNSQLLVLPSSKNALAELVGIQLISRIICLPLRASLNSLQLKYSHPSTNFLTCSSDMPVPLDSRSAASCSCRHPYT